MKLRYQLKTFLYLQLWLIFSKRTAMRAGNYNVIKPGDIRFHLDYWCSSFRIVAKGI